MNPIARHRTALAAGLGLLATLAARDAIAQEPIERLFAECAIEVPGVPPLCADAALALQALHWGVGAEMAAGGPLAVGPSTVGHRTEGSPRLVFEAGGIWSSFRHPDLTAGGAGDTSRSNLIGGRLNTVVGIFPGFSPAPTVGGVLSLDGVVALQAIGSPDSPTSSGTRFGWAAGVRLGVFRESFSLPGVTLSAMHHRLGEIRYGTEEGPGAVVAVEPRVTSFRLTVGKELWPVGVAGGLGWDRYGGDGRIRVTPASGSATGSAGPLELEGDRRYLFAGLSYTWLVTQVAAELVWAREPSPSVDLDGSGDFDPGGAGAGSTPIPWSGASWCATAGSWARVGIGSSADLTPKWSRSGRRARRPAAPRPT